MIKQLAIFGTGLVVGGLSSYFVTKKMLDKKYEEDLAKELELVDSHPYMVAGRTKMPDGTVHETEAYYSPTEPPAETVKKAQDEVVLEEDHIDPHPEGRPTAAPYLITQETYESDGMMEDDGYVYERLRLSYYRGADLWIDEQDEMVEHPAYIMSSEIVEMVETVVIEAEGDEVYVAVPKIQCMFAIELYSGGLEDRD